MGRDVMKKLSPATMKKLRKKVRRNVARGRRAVLPVRATISHYNAAGRLSKRKRPSDAAVTRAKNKVVAAALEYIAEVRKTSRTPAESWDKFDVQLRRQSQASVRLGDVVDAFLAVKRRR